LQSIQSITKHQLKLLDDACEAYKFPKLAQIKYLMVNRQVELVVYVNYLTKWEQILLKQEKNYSQLNYYHPLFLDFMEKCIVPQKEKAYESKVHFYHLFQPYNKPTLSYSIGLTVYKENIFKYISSRRGNTDDAIAADISKYYREQNLRGPEWVTVVSLDPAFIAVIISGVSSPFWKRYQGLSIDTRHFFKEATCQLSREAVIHSFNNHNILQGDILFLDFNWHKDTIFIVAVRNKNDWQKILYT
jgi:hypothetical protein